jgi:hypothetical protein
VPCDKSNYRMLADYAELIIDLGMP